MLVIQENAGARNVTNITLDESGTIDAASDLAQVRMYYDIDTTAPYNCAGEVFSGTEPQFGATSTFSGANGSVTFSSSVAISTTQAFCGYVVFDVLDSVFDGETFNINIANPSSDVVVTAGGTVNPPSVIGNSETVIESSEVTQTGYHWRNDDGSETGATSATGGIENQPALSFSTNTPQRIRLGVALEGTGNKTNSYRLEYAEKVSTCNLATGWSDVGAGGGAWDMFDSTFLVEGDSTTNIPIADGGVTDGADVFVSPNGGIRDASSQTGAITLADSDIDTIGESDSVSVVNGATTTITFNNSYDNPVVVASARYPRSGAQRTTRISAKTSNSFTVRVDNFDGTLGAGNTTVDYVVLEAGDWDIDDGAGGTRVYAGTTSTAVSDGRALVSNPGGATVIYPSPFTDPTVLASVVTTNDFDWTFASVYDGVDVDNPPTTSGFTTFLNDNFDSDGHTAAEDIDFIVFENSSGVNNSINFDFTTSGSANVSSAPISINYGTTYGTPPDVIIVQALTQLGADGGYALVDTDTAPTASAVTLATDEDGFGADRGHAAEEVAIVSFASGGDIIATNPNLSQFVELEYAIQATNNASEGVGYCFRVTDAGEPLRNYNQYPEATLSADVSVDTIGSQISSINAGTVDTWLGGTFAVSSNDGSRTVTSLTVTETGTIDAGLHVLNPRVAVEFDTSAPYDCASESYDGGETVLNGSSFLSTNGSSTVTGSGLINQTRSLCAYVLVDIASSTPNGQTINFEITAPNNDVVVTSSSVGPGSPVTLSSSTTVNAANLNQNGFHWRNDDGSESGASSATGGSENTVLENVFQNTTQRLRIAVANDGGLASASTELRLEYGVKVTTCSGVSG
jgi:hypothetical protein